MASMDPSQTYSRQRVHSPPFSYSHPHKRFRRDAPLPRPAPIATMNGSEAPIKAEPMGTPHGLPVSQGPWTTPTAQTTRPRPATIHEGFSFCVPETYEGLASWDSSSIPAQQTPNDIVSSRPISGHQQQQDFCPPPPMDNHSWGRKPCEENLELPSLDTEMIGQAYTADEAIPVLDLSYSNGHMETDSMQFDGGGVNPRRMSGSSFTVSTSGGLSDMPSYEDFSTALSDAPSFSSDYPPPSNRNSLMSSTQLSPVASPRMTPQSRSELVRTQSRGRASPSPRPGLRSAPYSVDGSRVKRWSTGSYGTGSNRRVSPFYHHSHEAVAYNNTNTHARMSSRHSSPTIAHAQLPLNFANLQAAQQHPYLMGGGGGGPQPPFHRNSMLLPSQLPSHLPSQFPPHGFHGGGGVGVGDARQFETPPPLLSHGLFRMLQSNGDPHTLHGHYTDLSDPPDLYGSLNEEQIAPPPEDMNPSDPDLVPHEQELRFDGDLYTPRWVRGHGNKRQGWCGICKPGRWLVLKNSAFWYDKSFTHGISAATGSPFQEPQETRRMDGNPDVWEGLCGSCSEWIALVSSKKKGTTWFRHAYKCHTHPKIKDAPKRRRESGHSRVLAAATTAKPKTEPLSLMVRQDSDQQEQSEPLTPQGTPATVSVGNTPTAARVPTPLLPSLHLHQQQHQQQQIQSPSPLTPQQQYQHHHDYNTPQEHHHLLQPRPLLQPPPLHSSLHSHYLHSPALHSADGFSNMI